MAKGYWITTYRQVRDPEALAAYAKLAVPALLAAGGRVLVRGMPAKVYESGVEQRVEVVGDVLRRSWLGARVAGAVTCPLAGACCLSNGTCSILFAAGCAGSGGIFGGEGSACAGFCGVASISENFDSSGNMPAGWFGAAAGPGSAWALASDFSHSGSNSVFTNGGTALVVHAGADDMKTDPAGAAGDRIACGVIKK